MEQLLSLSTIHSCEECPPSDSIW